MIGNSYQIDMLASLLRQAEVRHRVISQNIANVNTPGYRSMDISFEQQLSNAQLNVEKSDEQGQGKLYEVAGLSMRHDGNNVDVDRELGNLTKNSLRHEAFSHILAGKLAMLRSAITGQ